MIEGLPTEVLQEISEILDKIHPPSLLALARASKRCYAVASTVLYHTVKVTIADGDQRFRDACQLQERLVRDDAFAHVRRIILFSDSEGLRYPYLSLHPCERGREDDTALWRHLHHNKWPRMWPLLPIISIPDDEWEPVIHLVGQLTGLTDLFWACLEQLPLCLLRVLHERVSRCRLHHSTFNPSSPTPSSLTSHERTLITSPCLYSIGGLIHRISPTTLKLVRSFQTPALRRTYFWWRRRDLEIEAEEQNTENPNSLAVPREFIQVDGPRVHIPIPFAVIYKETAGDFSAMRALTLNVPLDPRGLPAPTDFPSLATLTFTCVVTARSTPPEYWDEVTTLLRNLPHLTTLQIKCWNRAISFIPSLSPSLRKLDLGTQLVPGGACLRDDHIHRLAEICPNLQHLTLEIRRSRGDAAEVQRYRSLGRLPRLQELNIYLDASPPGYIEPTPDGTTTTSRDTIIEPWFDEQDTMYLPEPSKAFREGHVHDVLVNSAIDVSLALSIFKVIDGAKPRTSPGRAAPLPLERLELCARGGEKFADIPAIGSSYTPLNQFLAALKREWRVERDVRNDSREVLHVQEVGRGIIMRRPQPPRTGRPQWRSHDPESDPYWFGLWRRVWPVQREGVHWWDDWESRPLELQTGASAEAG